MAASKIKLTVKPLNNFPAAKKLFIRSASAKEIEFVTRQAVKEGWHVGPYDFPCAYAFDPKGLLIGEVDGHKVCHISSISYPNHHTYIGGLIVDERHRGNGYGLKITDAVFNYYQVDMNYTFGFDVDSEKRLKHEKFNGFQTVWKTYVASIDLGKIATNLNGTESTSNAAVKLICDTNLEKLLDYDSFVFGTQRRRFMERWISVPGSFGWTAIDKKSGDIVGYAVLKQVIRGAGTEIGLAMAPLFADSAQIAKLLLKTAADECLANEAVPNTKLELFHPVGENCGEGASQLMNQVEAELTHIAYRMYSKGIPPGRQIKKIYGIASPSFD